MKCAIALLISSFKSKESLVLEGMRGRYIQVPSSGADRTIGAEQ
jgi:hypothetical protein